MDKTLMENARSMLSGACIEHKFSAKVVNTSCYLINQPPTSTLVDNIPQEEWIVRNPLFNIFEFLVVMLMCMFQWRKWSSWIIK
jgi:hypothetical protein